MSDKKIRAYGPRPQRRIHPSALARWGDELSGISFVPEYGDGLGEVEVANLEKLIRQGCTLDEAAEKSGHAKNTVLRYRRRLLARGVRVKGMTAPYERREIPYERETEIGLLVDRWGAMAIDEVRDDRRTLHEVLASRALPPDEELMRREEGLSL